MRPLLLASIVFVLCCTPRSTPPPASPAQPEPPPISGEDRAANIAAALTGAADSSAIVKRIEGPLRIEIQHSLFEEEESDGLETTVLDDAKAVEAWLASFHFAQRCPEDVSVEPPKGHCRWLNGLSVVGSPRCDDGGCCTFRPDGSDTIPLLHNTLFLDQICVEGDALRRIAFLDGD